MNANMNQLPDEAQQRRRVRRTALLLALVALGFYVAFIAIGVLRS